ncbi:MAG TPA: FAD-dependent oxidoreductase [Streptosporangiaceae bacterium]|nr:FAD-dependent oxidoreductase [Streptosporangiaceae bacterium]
MIGAGVLGVCVAARLAEAGIGVTLLEQARPGRAATRSSFAWPNANDKHLAPLASCDVRREPV